MTSIFQRALGEDFDRLHPQLRRRFSIGLDSGQACVGTGVMDRIWHGRGFTRPFLALGGQRNILVPATGTKVPFRIENYPYLDSFGRETVTFVRTFRLPARTHRFDATMIYQDGRIVDYLGTHQHVAADLYFDVDDEGSLMITSGPQKFLEGPIRCAIPRPCTGSAVVKESFNDDTGRFGIDVQVTNPWFGPLFGYQGSFTAEYIDVHDQQVPDTVKPLREEARC